MRGQSLVIAYSLLAALSLTWACKESPKKTPPEQGPIEPEPKPEPESQPEPEPEPDVDAFGPIGKPEPVPLDPDEVRISVSPGTLAVLQDNVVHLSAALPPDRESASCRWILDRGADEAVAGCTVEARVAGVSSDIGWILVIAEDGTEILRREGMIPLERLWVKGQRKISGRVSADPGRDAPPTFGPEGPPTALVTKNMEEIAWAMTPEELGVLQDTEVLLEADVPADTVCSWDLGDGETPLVGCRVTHLFREAHADQTVTLTVLQGDETLYSGARALPMERLSVTRRNPQPEGDLPACGEGCRRLAVAAVTGTGLDRSYSLASGTGATALVLFLHAPLPAASAIEDLARYLGARNIGLLPVACDDGLSKNALATLLTSHALSAGLVLHSDTGDLPARYSMQWGPVFLAALPTRADIPDEKWLTKQLETAAMFKARLLLSCRAFDRLTGEAPPLLPSPYRQYEKMRRGGLQLFVSGAHEAFYPGTYGNLRTLSPGRLQGSSAALLGQDAPAGPTAALVDLDDQRIRRVTGVVPAGDNWAPFPEENLPEKVGVYRLWK